MQDALDCMRTLRDRQAAPQLRASDPARTRNRAAAIDTGSIVFMYERILHPTITFRLR